MKRFLHIPLALALGALLLCETSARPDPPKTDDTAPQKQEETLKPRNGIKGLPNFAKVSDILYRGAQPESKGFEELKKLGVKTIINLRAGHSDEKHIKDLGFKYFSIPINTWNLGDEHSARFLDILLNPENQPVFVHCQHGSDRTGTMVAVYRIYVQKWTPEKAMKELPSFGFHKIWKNLKKYLKSFDAGKIDLELKKLRMKEPKAKR